jgi:serine/threonine-protein kinase
MGSVYVAEHQRISRKLAIKVLHPHMTSNRDIVQRFLAEARAASALDHPNIVEVFDAASLADGRDYIALEHLAGQPLDEYLAANGPLAIEPALRILAQVCCGLEAAHHRGIVHRDLKPANLFIAPTEMEPLRVKVLDFGIAKLTDTILAGSIATGSNAVAGTPAYMAPEQARGMRDIDHRADVYSLGAVAYRMMSGKLPYDGETLGEIVYQHLSTQPADVRAHRPDLPDGWGIAIMSALSSDPGIRPPSGRDLALRLAESTPDGMRIVRGVAGLLFSERWIERNREMVARLPATTPPLPPLPAATPPPLTTRGLPPVAALQRPPPGGTISHASPPSAPTRMERPVGGQAGGVPAAPVTTLTTASGLIEGRGARRRGWLPIVVAGGVAVAVVAAMVAVAGLTGSGSPTAGVGGPTDGGLSASDAGVPLVDPDPVLGDAGMAGPDPTGLADAAVPVSPDAAPTPRKPTPTPERGTGTLTLKVTPWAEVLINGRKSGFAPTTMTLPAGRYRVTLVNPAMEKRDTVRVTIRTGKNSVINRQWKE